MKIHTIRFRKYEPTGLNGLHAAKQSRWRLSSFQCFHPVRFHDFLISPVICLLNIYVYRCRA